MRYNEDHDILAVPNFLLAADLLSCGKHPVENDPFD